MIGHFPGCRCGCAPFDPFVRVASDQSFYAEVGQQLVQACSLYIGRDDPTQDPAPADNQGEHGTDAFASEELLIAAVLAKVILDKGAAVRDDIERVLEQYGVDQGRISNVIDAHQSEMENIFIQVEPQVEDAVSRTINVGAAQIPSGSTRTTPSSIVGRGTILEGYNTPAQMRDGIVAVARYSTNNFFNDYVIPAIHNEVLKALDVSNPLDVPDIQPILLVLNQRLKSVPYWNVVANAAASRGFHYGYLKAAQISGYIGYELVAVIDNVTSQICLDLDGTQFLIADAVNLMEKVGNAETTEQVKLLTPWLKPNEINGLSSRELASMGVMVPPFHGRCRTTLRPF